MTSRLLESSVKRRGAPPVPYAWLALGSTGRDELALASDQDNALAFADTDDPLVDEYFLQMATDVVEGLHRCGFPPMPTACSRTHREWRLQRSAWLRAFADCLNGVDNERLLRAAIGFDFRHVAGDLSIVPELNQVIRQAPCHARFLGGLAELGSEVSRPRSASAAASRHRWISRRTGCFRAEPGALLRVPRAGSPQSTLRTVAAAVQQAGAPAAMRRGHCETRSSA